MQATTIGHRAVRTKKEGLTAPCKAPFGKAEEASSVA